MSNEEQIDWLCRLRSWLTSIGMPNEWRSNFDQVLADVIYMLKSRECYIKFDAISREKVLECLKKYTNAVHYIEKLPSIYSDCKENQRWIPVSEKLPRPCEKNEDGLTAKYYLIQNEYEDMLVARYDGVGWEQIYQREYLEDRVIAWMPLPTPYKASPTGAEGSDKE